MPTIPVNLGEVTSTFEDLPLGEYYGEIEKVVFHPAKAEGKFPQLRCQYLVIDGDYINKRQSQFLSLSPKAMGFVKAFFAKFGLGDTPNFEVDDDTNELIEPYIAGAKVIFRMNVDQRDATRVRADLVSVEEFGEEEPTPPPAPKPAPAVARRAAPAPAPEPEAEEELEEIVEEEEAPAPAPAPRPTRPVPTATAPRPAPQRRTLR